MLEVLRLGKDLRGPAQLHKGSVCHLDKPDFLEILKNINHGPGSLIVRNSFSSISAVLRKDEKNQKIWKTYSLCFKFEVGGPPHGSEGVCVWKYARVDLWAWVFYAALGESSLWKEQA